jgi:hypothetical protein
VLQAAIGATVKFADREWGVGYLAQDGSLASDTIAGFPDKQNKCRNQAGHDEHPVLTLEAQKGEMLNQELHRCRPVFMQNKRSRSVNILFIYL